MERGDRNISDCDYAKYKNPSIVIQKFTSLCREQITRNDFRRQKEYLDQLIETCKHGFFISDLHDLMFLIEHLIERAEEVDVCADFLDEILQICVIPPIMNLSSDVLTYAKTFEAYFAMLGYALTRLKKHELLSRAANVLRSLLSKNKNTSRNHISLEARIHSALNSQLPEIIAQLLPVVDEKIYSQILDLTTILVKESHGALESVESSHNTVKRMERGDRNISDCDYAKYKNPSIVIQKFTSLCREQITRNDFRRQKEYLDQLIETCKHGFFISDLHDLMFLIEHLIERAEEVDVCADFLDEILQICVIPPIMNLSSDVLTYAKTFEAYFAMLGYALTRLKKHELLSRAANVLRSLLSKNKNTSRNHISLEARIHSALTSQLPEIIAQLLPVVDEKIYSQILDLTTILVKESHGACKIFIKEDALNSLLIRLEPTWKERFPDKPPPPVPTENILHYDKISIIILILLRYMMNTTDNIGDVKSIQLFSLWNVQYAFRLFARTNQSLNRNNILVILLKMVKLFKDLLIIRSGLAKDLVLIGFIDPYSSAWAKGIKLSTDDDDCLYLKLLIAFLPVYLSFFGGIRVIEEHRIIHHLLALSRNKYAIKWNPQQACVLSHISLDVLMKIVPFAEEEFIENNGPHIFLDIIGMYKTNDIDTEILRKCLEALLHIIQNTHMILESVLYNNGYSLMLDLCVHIILKSFDNLGKNCLSLVFQIFTILFKYNSERDDQVISICITYLKTIIFHRRGTPLRDIREIISVLNFIWEHIVKVEENAKEFVRLEGTYLMLDMVQKFPFVVQLVTLGALVDLCEYGDCIPYLITWKRNGQTILPLLMKLFREDNKRLRVKRGAHGEIKDSRYPIMGKDQWFLTFCTCKPMMVGNACISDLFISARPKIYALIQMLEMRHLDKLEIANEHYKTYDERLQPVDQITKLIADNYLALKLGEAWVELKELFERMGVVPTYVDSKILYSLTERADKFAKYLQSVQNDIIQGANFQELVKEFNLYKYLQEGKLTDALGALSELKYIARCSENMFRISEKYKQNKQINRALKRHSIQPHRTFYSEIRVTPVFNETIDLKHKLPVTTEDIDVLPVSPVGSENRCDVEIPEDLLESPT